MPTLVVTVLGTDRSGLVSTLSARMSRHGASWLRSEMAQLAGTFAGIVEVDVPADRSAALIADLESLAAEGLRVNVEGAPPGGVMASVAGQRFSLHLVGADHPGIVAEISALLARHGVNVESISTEVSDAPMAGGTLFEADATLSVAADVGVADLEAALEALADELMVDLDLAPDET